MQGTWHMQEFKICFLRTPSILYKNQTCCRVDVHGSRLLSRNFLLPLNRESNWKLPIENVLTFKKKFKHMNPQSLCILLKCGRFCTAHFIVSQGNQPYWCTEKKSITWILPKLCFINLLSLYQQLINAYYPSA